MFSSIFKKVICERRNSESLLRPDLLKRLLISLALFLFVGLTTVAQPNISVSVSPQRGGLTVGQTLSFIATVSNDSQNQGVTWRAIGGSFSLSATTSGAATTYTAPAIAGVYTLTATSVTDASKSASVTIGVTDLNGVFTYHNDLSRDGSNPSEYALTASNVSAATFGKLFSCTVDGAIYAQPLWVANLVVGGARRNVVFVATEHDSLFAFDADANTTPCTPLWQVSLIDTPHGGSSSETSVPSGTSGNLVGTGRGDIAPEVGVTGTPVIDRSTNTLYVVSKSVITSGPAFYQRLHAIDLTTGNEKFGGPVVIAATYPGTGDGGTTVTFNPRQQNQRPGLALVNGIVYIAWASHEDTPPCYGWIMGYSASNLAQTVVLSVSPNVGYGGIWMGGGAPSADSSNNLYLITGNAIFDATNSTAPNNDYGDSFLKLSSGLAISQYFTPSDQSNDNASNNDFGSGGAAILPNQPSGPVPHLVIGGGKDGYLYLLNRDAMGGLGDSNAWQRFNFGNPIFATGAFWSNTFYMAGAGGHLQAFSFNTSTGKFNTSNVSQSSTSYGFPGSTPSVSSSGTTNGIVWALDNSNYCTPQSGGCGPAILHAYDATSLATDLWNSSQGTGNAAGNAVKFAVPTVANGKVYVGTRGNNTGGATSSTTIPGELDVYGLLNAATLAATQAFSTGAGTFAAAALGPAPTLTSASPNTAMQSQSNLPVALTGTNFLAGPVCSFGSGITVNSCTYNSATQITANISIAANATVGTNTISITDTDGQVATLPGGFSITLNSNPFAPILVNGGGPAYTDSLAQVWSADKNFTGGRTASTTHAIANTADPTLYQTERYGNSTYQFTVPNGGYNVTLKFAEIYWSSTGQRIFNVAINGTPVLTNFDIIAAAGASFTAIDKTFPVATSTGAITIQFTSGSADLPKISAIAISSNSGVFVQVSPATASLYASQQQQFTTSVTGNSNTAVTWTYSPQVGTLTASGLYTAPASVTTAQTVSVTATSQADTTKSGVATINLLPPAGSFSPIFVNSGGPTYTDSLGNHWSADKNFTGGNTSSTTHAIASTPDPTLYQTERYGNSTYQFIVPTGNYSVVLKFAEIYWTSTGRRLFNTSINGTQVLTNFDIVAAAGAPYTAIDKSFPVTVTGSSITIQFTTGSADLPKISAIEIYAGSGVGIQINPISATLFASQSQQFAATVTGTTNLGVTWTYNPQVGTLGTSGSTAGLYTAPASITTSQTVSVTATSVADPTQSSSATASLSPPPTATPTFSPGGGTYSSAQSVTISDTTSGATIYYTTNGTTPTTASTVYSGAISVALTETIQAIAVAPGYAQSAVGSSTYTISLPTAATPTFSPGGGTYSSAQSVTISDTTTGATIYYTTDGTTPTTASNVYSGAISVSATETIQAIAVAGGYLNSAVASATFTITGGGTSNIGYVNHAACYYSGGSSCTTSAVNMTGANLLVMKIMDSAGSGAGVPSDSSGNIWYGPYIWCSNGSTCGSGIQRVQTFFAPNAIVSSSQTFKWALSGDFASMAVEGFSNTAASSPEAQYASNNSSTASAATLTAGSVTPSSNGQVLTTGLAVPNSTTSTPSINNSFNVTDGHYNQSGMTGFAMAYYIEPSTSATPENPTWSWTTNSISVADNLSFLPANSASPLVTVFCDFENSANATTVTAAILVGGCHAANPVNNVTGNWANKMGGDDYLMTVSASAQHGQVTGKNVGGTIYTDLNGTRGIRLQADVLAGPNWVYTMPAPHPNRPNSATANFCIYTNIPATNNGYYSIGGWSQNGGDFESVMFHRGNIYLETKLNPNGADDVGSFFAYTPNTWYCISEQFVGYLPGGTYHTLKIYNTSGNLLSTQQKQSNPSYPGGPYRFGMGMGGDSVGPSGSFFYYDDLIFQWEGAPEYPIPL